MVVTQRPREFLANESRLFVGNLEPLLAAVDGEYDRRGDASRLEFEVGHVSEAVRLVVFVPDRAPDVSDDAGVGDNEREFAESERLNQTLAVFVGHAGGREDALDDRLECVVESLRGQRERLASVETVVQRYLRFSSPLLDGQLLGSVRELVDGLVREEAFGPIDERPRRSYKQFVLAPEVDAGHHVFLSEDGLDDLRLAHACVHPVLGHKSAGDESNRVPW